MDLPMNPFEFAARMWRGAPAMVAAQEDELGGQIEFTGQELADIIAFVHDSEEQKAFSAGDIPEGVPLKDFGPKLYAPRLESVGSNIKVISNQEITLNCGTKAYRTEISWLWDNRVPITTFLVSAYKDDKVIFVCAHPWKNHATVEAIVQSLTIK